MQFAIFEIYPCRCFIEACVLLGFGCQKYGKETECYEYFLHYKMMLLVYTAKII